MNRSKPINEVEEDDPYADFETYHTNTEAQELAYDANFQKAVATSYGNRPPPTAAKGAAPSLNNRKGMVVPPSSMGKRPITGAVDGGARPMTAVKGAGYSSKGPMQVQAGRGNAPPLEPKSNDSPEEKVKVLERSISKLIEESIMAASKTEFQLALEKAREARRKEKTLSDVKERLLPNNEQINLDLTYSVLFNLANQLAANNMDSEALSTFQQLIKNKTFNNSGRLKANIGNIYFKQGEYEKAIKYYKMALDQISNMYRSLKSRLKQNICLAYVRLHQYDDAATVLEHAMDEEPSFRTAFNLLLCYRRTNHRDMMKKTFERMLSIEPKAKDDEEKYLSLADDPRYSLLLEAIRNDPLRQIEKDNKQEAEQCIMTAAKIIAPVIDVSYTAGYEWCIEHVKNSIHMPLAHNLDIDKAIGFLKQKDFEQAIETLKSFEKKDSRVASAAATNLSFLYNLEGQINLADKYAEIALQSDRYNPSALVNKGNVHFNRGDFEKAREFYHEALQNDSSCVEALYNFGLANKRLYRYNDAIDSFTKLLSILRDNAQVMYQLADLHMLIGMIDQGHEWLQQVNNSVPSDASIFKKMGDINDQKGDQIGSLNNYNNSYRLDPTNLEVIEWLGSYFLESQMPDSAIPYFERAAIVQPGQVKWQLMVASCLRRSGSYQAALEVYKIIHKRFPDNIECLKILTKFCVDMNLKEADIYADKLNKAEKRQQLKDERASSARQKSGKNRSEETDPRQSSGRNRQPNEKGGGGIVQYSDPLGARTDDRPRTANARKKLTDDNDDDDDDDAGDLLPD